MTTWKRKHIPQKQRPRALPKFEKELTSGALHKKQHLEKPMAHTPLHPRRVQRPTLPKVQVPKRNLPSSGHQTRSVQCTRIIQTTHCMLGETVRATINMKPTLSCPAQDFRLITKHKREHLLQMKT